MNAHQNTHQIVYGVKVFDIDYLLHAEYSENDLDNLLSTNSKSLLYSIIIGMFRYIGNNKRNTDIVKFVKNDKDWMSKYSWSRMQCSEYEDIICKVIKRLYCYDDVKSLSIAQWYITLYGFNVKDKKNM